MIPAPPVQSDAPVTTAHYAGRPSVDRMEAWLRAFVNTPAFLERYPLYAYILDKLRLVESTATMAMAVSCEGRYFRLHVNVDYLRHNPKFIRGILLHEVHHIVLGHLTAAKFHSPAHPDLMRLAMEISANEFIEEPLPKGHIRWEDFRAFGIRGGQSTLERYERLVQARQNGFAIPTPKVPHDCVTQHGPASQPHPLAGRSLNRVLAEVLAQIEKIEQRAEKSERKKPKLAGRDPGDLIEELQETAKPPETYLDWKAALRRFVGRDRRRVYTLSYPSRRFPDRLGQVPGRRRLHRPDGQPSILAAIDTSGSMGATELNEIARQFVPLSRLAKITVVECDAAIQKVYPFKGTITTLLGRGGTDFSPVFAPEFLRKHRPDGVVYFTDGQGSFPLEKPPVRTLWVLTSPGDFACPWGERAWLPWEPGGRAVRRDPYPDVRAVRSDRHLPNQVFLPSDISQHVCNG